MESKNEIYGGVEWDTNFNLVSDGSANEYENMLFAYGDERRGTYIAFDTEKELIAFKTLRKKITSTYYKFSMTKERVRDKDRYHCMRFCFNMSEYLYINETEIHTFNTLSSICNINPDLLRLRLSYELYITTTVFKCSKLNLKAELPNEIISELLWLDKSFIVVELATFIYRNPSVIIADILSVFSNYGDHNVLDLLYKLEEQNYIGINEDHYYFITRNPAKRKSKFNWSREMRLF